MKALSCLLFIVFFQTAHAQEGKPFPPFNISSDAGSLNNDSLKGKVVFINFWFAACPPCIAEFEGLNEMYQRLKDSAHIAFISFSYESPAEIQATRERHGISYPVYSITREECRRLLNGGAYPTNMILDTEGRIVYSKTGGAVDRKEARSFVLTELYRKVLYTAGVRPITDL